MNYANGKTAALNDQVVGVDKAGRPVGGVVIDTNAGDGAVLISPCFQNPVWVGSDRCFLAADAVVDPGATSTSPAAAEPPPES